MKKIKLYTIPEALLMATAFLVYVATIALSVYAIATVLKFW